MRFLTTIKYMRNVLPGQFIHSERSSDVIGALHPKNLKKPCQKTK